MRKHTKRLLAFLLTLVMVVSLVNVKQFSVTAEAPETKTEVSRTETFTKTDTAVKSGDVKKEESKKDSSADEDEKQDKQENGESDTAALKDKADADDTADASGQKDQTAVQKEKDENDAGTADKQDADSKEDSKMEETEGKEAAEEDKKSDSVSNQTDTSSEKDKSGQTAATGQTNSGKTESSAAQKKEDTDTPTDNQKEDEKNNIVTDEKSDTVKDEIDTDDTLTYAQTARKALAKMGAAEAFAEGNTIENAEEYFSIVDEEGKTISAAPATFSLTTGDAFADSVPDISEYDFVNATFNGIEVKSIGELTYDGETYVYYTTADSSTSLTAMVLDEGEKINLNYELHRETYSITYNLSGDSVGVDLDAVFGTDKPNEVKGGDSYAFRVTIPRGYEADIRVNSVSKGKLGVEPTYIENGDVITADTSGGRPAELTLSGTYEVNNVNADQTVTVDLTRRDSYDFSATLWTQTKYASDNGTPRANFGDKTGTFNGVGENDTEKLWEFTTSTNTGTEWILDSLQINGTKLELPYGEYSRDFQAVSRTTTLPSGTVVTVILTKINRKNYGSYWNPEYRYARTYTISVSNCYEDITITGGNLNASGWTEIIPDRLTGVEFQIFDRQTGTGSTNTWKTMEQSEPFGVGSNDNSKNYWFGNSELRYRLLPGYVNPVITYGTTSGIDSNNLGSLIGNTQGPDQDGWYKFSIQGQNGNKITMLRIEASIGYYDVSYDGNLPSDFTESRLENLPGYDNGDYNIVNNGQIIVSSMIPTDQNNGYVFNYWTLEGYEDSAGNPIQIRPNQVIDLEEVAEYAVEQNGFYVLPLQANWEKAEDADTITYHIQFVLEDENGAVTGTINQGSYQAPVDSTIILDTESDVIEEFLNTHPEYVLNETKTIRYNEKVLNGQILTVYFTKAVTNVTLTKNVIGNMGDRNKEFDFELSIGDEKKTGVSLKDEDTETFQDEKIGDTIRFKEKNADGYTVTVAFTDEDETTKDGTITVGEDGYYSLKVTKGLAITVTNEKEINAPTGLSGGSDSWMILLGAAAVFAVTSGLYGLRRKKVGAHD